MPQIFNVVRCFCCSTFQVHQVKKAKKWVCKVCGEKQSLIKVYSQGTGAECRQDVQKLNSLRQDMDEKEYQMAIDQEFLDVSEETDGRSFTSGANGFRKLPSSSEGSSSSKWSKFLPCEADTETSQLQMEEADYVEEEYNKEEKRASLQKFYKSPYQEKRKNPFSEVYSRDSLTNSGYLMKKPRTAIKSNFQLSSVNCDKSNNWSHSVSIESRNPGTNLITSHQPIHCEQLSSNALTSDTSCKMSPSDMDLSKSRKDISHSYTFYPSYKNLPRFTECKETNIKHLKESQCDENNLFWMAKSQSCLSGAYSEDLVVSSWNVESGLSKEGNDFPVKDLVVNSWNIESGHSKSLNCENGLKNLYNGSTHTNNENILQRNNCDNISLSSNVNKQKTDADGQILPLSSKLSSNKQNKVTCPSLTFSNDLDKGILAINSTQSNSLENIFQLDESEIDLDF